MRRDVALLRVSAAPCTQQEDGHQADPPAHCMHDDRTGKVKDRFDPFAPQDAMQKLSIPHIALNELRGRRS